MADPIQAATAPGGSEKTPPKLRPHLLPLLKLRVWLGNGSGLRSCR